MLSLSAATSDKSVLLTWTTATEAENFGFEIERRIIGQLASKESAGASAWEKVGFVNGSGTSSKPVEYTFEDTNLPDGRYAYRIKQIDRDGTYRYTEAIEVSVGDVPTVFSLDQNYPNPFNPMTTIQFGLPKPSSVKIVLYDLLGKAVMTIVEKDLPLGFHRVEFDGSRFASSVYFYRLTAKGLDDIADDRFVQTRKMILLR
ncbi:MAG: T9SS type A sorting domain-containing protein, partial [Bacteroidetes bacterium]|nr:T9SS type A sorting domain-containing protein [Bacteroidota bacterium]